MAGKGCGLDVMRCGGREWLAGLAGLDGWIESTETDSDDAEQRWKREGKKGSPKVLPDPHACGTEGGVAWHRIYSPPRDTTSSRPPRGSLRLPREYQGLSRGSSCDPLLVRRCWSFGPPAKTDRQKVPRSHDQATVQGKARKTIDPRS